ncbi:hypothetical protein [Polyangium jinanense]|uniref:Uncharacterized protein n=1 Tax=Polyangium jinanense TaxID=2829994 RepID=A0A9X3XE29_9BACT|nr:hypothetical protein [Polyangium jinanense]MDC3960670.1 hypothetical protein [Polyangium jinanense]MDC3986958.1 hypothetical protein [Polyangium jinanense]
MRSTKKTQVLSKALALSFLLGAGGCVVLGYDFNKQPPISCERAQDCPGEDSDCGTRACEKGVCKYVNVKPAGESPLGQRLDDCQEFTCDGTGHAVSKPAPDQTPDDGSECTENKCIDGTPLFVPLEQNAACGKDKLLKCDGLGSCAGCTMPSECGDDGPCLKWSCESGVCIRAFEPAGTVVANTVTGDCKAEACDGAGNLGQIPDPNDAADDGDSCTADICKDGATVRESAANGTACGMGCQSCTDGLCGDCSPGFVCEGTACVSVGEQPVGAVCTENPDCMSGFCVQGVCCESACDGKCMGCVNTATGMPNGVCAPALDGNNPGGRCEGADTCVGGKCRCENGVQDGNELKVDCGGSCAPCKGTWVCNGDAGCGAPIAECCFFDCIGCGDETTACFDIQSKECFIGEQSKSFTGGTFWDGCAKCNRMTCICQ